MRTLVIYTFAVVLASVLLAEGVRADIDLPPQACANMLGSLNGDNLWVHFNGTRLNVNIPVHAGGTEESNTTIYYQWTDVSQYQRTGSQCLPIKNPLVEAQMLSDCDCTLTPFSNVTKGVNTTGYVLRVSDCRPNQNDMVLVATISVSNDTTHVAYNDTMEYSAVDSFTYTTPKGGLKFSFHLDNWNWNQTNLYPAFGDDTVNQTYLALGMKFGFQTPLGFTVNRIFGTREFNLSATLGEATILLKNDAGTLLDGQPAVPLGDDSDSTDPLPIPAGAATEGLVLPLPIAFCQPVPRGPSGFLPIKLKQWKQIYYDPSLQVLFSGPVTSGTSSRAWVTPVVVVLVIVALVVVVLLVVFFVPPVRNAVMPYNKDKVHAQRIQEHQHFNEEAKSASRKQSTWTPSAKPT